MAKEMPTRVSPHPTIRSIHLHVRGSCREGLQPGELGRDGYQPEISTIAQHDENELHMLELVRQYTNIPVPKLIYQLSG